MRARSTLTLAILCLLSALTAAPAFAKIPVCKVTCAAPPAQPPGSTCPGLFPHCTACSSSGKGHQQLLKCKKCASGYYLLQAQCCGPAQCYRLKDLNCAKGGFTYATAKHNIGCFKCPKGYTKGKVVPPKGGSTPKPIQMPVGGGGPQPGGGGPGGGGPGGGGPGGSVGGSGPMLKPISCAVDTCPINCSKRRK